MANIRYRCISCRNEISIEVGNPNRPGEPPRPDDYPRVRCFRCGGASAPTYYLEHAYDSNGHFDWQALFRRWSHCPNAYQCELHDQYGPDCEEGQVMQKCFVALHAKLDVVLHFQKQDAGPKQGRRAKSQAPDK